MLHFIFLNGVPTQLGAPLPSVIRSLEIRIPMPIAFPEHQVPELKAWLNDLVDRLDCDYFSYNNILIPTNEITKF